MFVLLFCLITFTRATVVYISNNLIGRMAGRLDSTENVEDDSNEETNDKEDHAAEDNATEIDATSHTVEKSKKSTTVIDSEWLVRSNDDDLSIQKRYLDQVRPSTSGSAGLTVGSLKNRNVPDVTVTNGIAYEQTRTERKTEDPVKNKYESKVEVTVECQKKTTLKFHCPEDSPVYNMNLKRRGFCVIFNQQNFNEGNGTYRAGSEIDVASIQRTFGALGFEVIQHNDFTFYDILSEIERLKNLDHTDSDCLCIFVLTHGDRFGRLYARDVAYPLLNIWKPFMANSCSSLASKPKLFFIQACRGPKLEEGVRGKSEVDSEDGSYSIPTNADFLFGHSTVEGYSSWRNSEKGTWYIQCLCNVIEEHWRNTDLLKMLTITARKVAFGYVTEDTDEYKNKKQMPSTVSTLTRDLFFTSKNEC